MNTPTIEELRSEEAHADTNFIELQALRKIHQETLKKLDAAESLVIQLDNDKRKIAQQLECTISHLNEALAHAANREPSIDAIKGEADKDPGSKAF